MRDAIEARYFEEIRRLRTDGLSWREIAEYLAHHRKFNVSHGYLQQVFAQLSYDRIAEAMGGEIDGAVCTTAGTKCDGGEFYGLGHDDAGQDAIAPEAPERQE